jgi:hypothetical protein
MPDNAVQLLLVLHYYEFDSSCSKRQLWKHTSGDSSNLYTQLVKDTVYYKFTDWVKETHDWVYTYTVERLDFTMPDNAGSNLRFCAAPQSQQFFKVVKKIIRKHIDTSVSSNCYPTSEG